MPYCPSPAAVHAYRHAPTQRLTLAQHLEAASVADALQIPYDRAVLYVLVQDRLEIQVKGR